MGEPVEEETGLWQRFKGWLVALSSKAKDDNVEQLIRAYANGLYISARGLSSADDDVFDRVARAVLTELRRDSMDLREILAIEARLNRLYPTEIKRRQSWAHRERFQRVATPGEVAAYLASSPPAPLTQPDGPTPPVPDAVREADDMVLLNHIHTNHLMTLLREQAIRDLKRWIQYGLLRSLLLFAAAVGALLFAGGRGWITGEAQYFGIGVGLLYFIGRVGAAMSVVQRLQRAVRDQSQDAFQEVTALCTGRRGFSIAMLSGGIFAVLLYVVFGAGLGQNLGMSGGIFPEVKRNSAADDNPERRTGALVQAQSDTIAQTRASAAAQSGTAAATTNSSAGLPSGPATSASPGAGATRPPDPGPIANGPASVTPASPRPRAGLPPNAAPKPIVGGGPREVAEDTVAAGECGPRRATCMPDFVSQIGKHLGFQEYPDFLKMLLLAFLAGFAERLVPDAIDRLIQRRSIGEDATSVVVKAGS